MCACKASVSSRVQNRQAGVPQLVWLQVPQAAGGVARFAFLDLCGHPLGAADFMALARRFHTVFVENIPAMSMQVCRQLHAQEK